MRWKASGFVVGNELSELGFIFQGLGGQREQIFELEILCLLCHLLQFEFLSTETLWHDKSLDYFKSLLFIRRLNFLNAIEHTDCVQLAVDLGVVSARYAYGAILLRIKST